MKVRVSTWAITWRYLIFSLILIVVLFLAFFGVFFTPNSEGVLTFVGFGVSQIMIVVLVPAVLVVFYLLSVFTYYYVIEDKYFIMKRFGREFIFDYKNIEFIDIDESKRKNQVIFYSPKSRTRYLLGDKDGKLLETLIKKCPKTMSVQEFKMKHPEERY
jgi:hypothetical protein